MLKVVLVTGGSSGIGKSISEFLFEKGFKVYGTSRNPEKYQEEVSFPLLKMEVTHPNSINEVIAYIINQEGQLDIVINNAGVGITGPIEETPTSEIIKAFDINLHGPINVIKSVLPQMRKQKSGLIINITSIAGYMVPAISYISCKITRCDVGHFYTKLFYFYSKCFRGYFKSCFSS